MANLFSPRVLRRGLEAFAAISVLGLVALLVYGGNLGAFARAMLTLHWAWVLAAVGLASMDWVGGGLRLWVAVRHLMPGASLRGMILAGGINTWGALITPSQTGGGPFMIWVMKRFGVPYPEATIAAFVTFVATVVFFGVAGPIAVAFGAGRSLEQHGVPLVGLSFYDLFRASLGMFVLIGFVLLAVMVFPSTFRNLMHALAVRLGRWRPALAHRVERLRVGIDEMHDALVKFFRGKGWLALFGTVLLSAPTHANKLLAGYVTLRALGIHANFADVLLLQTLIAFLLYFAPTPGGSGVAELLAAALMSIYVPNALLASYTVLWRLTTGYLTATVGWVVFWHWLRRRLSAAEKAALVEA